MSSNRVLNYDFNKLPEAPFSVYLLNREGRVSPKQIFTVTSKQINEEKQKIELFIRELGRYIEYDHLYVTKLENIHVN